MAHPVFTFTVQQLKQKIPTEKWSTLNKRNEPVSSPRLAAIETKPSYAIAKL